MQIDGLVLDGLVRLPLDRSTRRLAGPAARLGAAVVAGRGRWLLRWEGLTPETIAGLVYAGRASACNTMLRETRRLQRDLRDACW